MIPELRRGEQSVQVSTLAVPCLRCSSVVAWGRVVSVELGEVLSFGAPRRNFSFWRFLLSSCRVSDSCVRTATSQEETNGCPCQTFPMTELKQNPCLLGKVNSLEKEEGHTFGVAVGKAVAVGLSETLSSEERSGVRHGGPGEMGSQVEGQPG